MSCANEKEKKNHQNVDVIGEDQTNAEFLVNTLTWIIALTCKLLSMMSCRNVIKFFSSRSILATKLRSGT